MRVGLIFLASARAPLNLWVIARLGVRLPIVCNTVSNDANAIVIGNVEKTIWLYFEPMQKEKIEN